MNILKKLKLLSFYKKVLKENKNELLSVYNIKTDSIYRCYTVLNFPPEIQENIKKLGYHYLDAEVKKYLNNLDEFFRKKGLLELIGIDKINRVSEYSVLVVLRFSLLDTKKLELYKRITYIIISLLIIFLMIKII
jgi:hypothetical protein